MPIDLEQALTRELDEIASRLDVPALPPLPAAPPREHRPSRTPALVAAAAVVTVMATVGALLLFAGGGDREEPAPAPPPTTADAQPSLTRLPTVPVVVDGALYVLGRRVPGEWFSVDGPMDGWVAQRADGTWWSGGLAAQPERIDGVFDQGITSAPEGGTWAGVDDQNGRPVLTQGEASFGDVRFDGPAVPDSDPAPRVAAVTIDGLVVVRGADYQLLWQSSEDGKTVDLSTVDLAETAPGQVVIGNTVAGFIVTEGDLATTDSEGDTYLASIDADGTLTRRQSLPAHQDLIASREWLAWTPPGTLGGESAGVGELRVQRLDGGDAGVLTPPDGWMFAALRWTWEEDDLVAVVVRGDDDTERVVRCRPATQRCVFVPVR